MKQISLHVVFLNKIIF